MLVLPLLGALYGCSSLNSALGGNSEKQALTETQWNYASAALTLKVSTDAALNNYDGEAHSVVLAVVQSSEAGPFYQLLDTPEQAARVLQGGRPPSGLQQVTRYALEPGRKASIRLDRAQGARFLGVIAAFYDVPLAKTARLFNLPVDVGSSGIMVHTYKATPAPAELTLQLGASDITAASIAAAAAEQPDQGEVRRPNTVGALQLNDLSE
jgi:type VI secretion system VasD/TssJ family lipoprotein